MNSTYKHEINLVKDKANKYSTTYIVEIAKEQVEVSKLQEKMI